MIYHATYKDGEYLQIVCVHAQSEKVALKFLKTIGYNYDKLSNDNWNYFGTNYKLSIQR